MGSNLQSLTKRAPRSKQRKRTLNLWVLILGFLVMSIYGWARFFYSWRNAYWLNFAGVRPGYVYFEVTGMLWGLTGLIAVVWIYLLRSGYRLAGFMAAVLLTLMYWADRMLFYRGGLGPNVLFAAIMTLFLLAYTGLVLQPFAGQRAAAPRIEKRGRDVEIRARN